MTFSSHAVAAALLLVLLSPPQAAVVDADEQVLLLDLQTAAVTFTLGATLHTVHGTARVSSGRLTFDAETGEASGEVVVDARSAATGSEGRDRDMHEKVLQSALYPTIVLHASRVEGSIESGRVVLYGNLEICGGGHLVSIPAEVRREGELIVVSGALTVPYVAWGMHDPSKLLLRVAKEVEVVLELRGTLATP